jgi:signal transducing adaptor molecule
MTHEKVKRRALYLVSLWTGEFENNSQLGLMEELYNTLKAKSNPEPNFFVILSHPSRRL